MTSQKTSQLSNGPEPPITGLYRFRSAEKLLGANYRELQNQTIYFADPGELNDPMEGTREIFWRGDRIVWTNLLKHYLYCLNLSYLTVAGIRPDDEWTGCDIPIFGGRHNLSTSIRPEDIEFKDIYNHICSRIMDECGLFEVVDRIVHRDEKVTGDQLLLYLRPIHETALSVLHDEHFVVRKTLTPVEPRRTLPPKPTVSRLNEPTFWDRLSYIERVGGREALRDLFKSVPIWLLEQQLSRRYDRADPIEDTFEINREAVAREYPSFYVESLKRLLGPPWYAACFMKNHNRSSAWAHYGDGHRGLCLIFGTHEPDAPMTLSLRPFDESRVIRVGDGVESAEAFPYDFHEVKYATETVEVDFFRSIFNYPTREALVDTWYSDESGRRR